MSCKELSVDRILNLQQVGVNYVCCRHSKLLVSCIRRSLHRVPKRFGCLLYACESISRSIHELKGPIKKLRDKEAQLPLKTFISRPIVCRNSDEKMFSSFCTMAPSVVYLPYCHQAIASFGASQK